MKIVGKPETEVRRRGPGKYRILINDLRRWLKGIYKVTKVNKVRKVGGHKIT